MKGGIIMKGKAIFGIVMVAVSLLVAAIMVVPRMSCDDYIDEE